MREYQIVIKKNGERINAFDWAAPSGDMKDIALNCAYFHNISSRDCICFDVEIWAEPNNHLYTARIEPTLEFKVADSEYR